MRVKNWKKFQRYGTRRPPWIKLYRTILDNREIQQCSDKAFRILVGCWLLASEDESGCGNLPCTEDIAFRLRMSIDDVSRNLLELSAFLECVQDVCNTCANDVQGVCLETETEKEREKERERESNIHNDTRQDDFKECWEIYANKKSKGQAEKTWNKLIKEKLLPSQETLIAAIEAYKRTREVRDGYQKHFSTWLNAKCWEDENTAADPETGKPVVLKPRNYDA